MSEKFLYKAGLKVMKKNLSQYETQDPLYENYVDKKGKTRQRKREIPPGLSKRDANILKSVNRRAHYLDKGFNFCGLRFGWTAIIGIIPMAGDIADATLNYYLVVRKARQADLPGWLVRRMLLNNMISAGIGCVPIAGDIAIAVFKANSQNARLLRDYLEIRGQEYLKAEAEGRLPLEDKTKGKGSKKSKGKGKAEEKSKEEQLEDVKPGAGMKVGESVTV
ncbi:hypothetical protein SCHPADRAFT_903434 [Schizopora paradoxa]|uniref:DUF4112 domain-containing protein n=1 Tax=Schizopora paradoxa TaxID=27342 RepID=A0A0H2RQV1_9AGAM|nr:hypothetical protein SCHPADRAFT_903434 [Schizopora paradoxa]